MSEEKSLLSKIGNAALNAGAAISGAVGTVREIQEMHIDYAVKEKTYDLIKQLMEVQQKQMELNQLLMESKNKIIDLEQEKNNLTQWKDDKLRYELFAPETPGTIVYRFKPSSEDKQPLHYLCIPCYEKHIKSPLQEKPSMPHINYSKMICPNCKLEYSFNKSVFKKINHFD